MTVPMIAIAAAVAWSGCASAPQTPVAAPRVVLDDQRFDAGRVEQGAIVRHRFVIRNGGGSPLRISGVRASCDCSAAVVTHAILAPREAGAIEVSIDTGSLAGETLRTFTVFSNDPANPAIRLEAGLDVVPHVVVEPRELYLGEVERGARPDRIVVLAFPRHREARTVGVKPRGEIVKPRLRGSGQVGVAIDADAPLGSFRETVAVRTTHPERPVVDVVVAGVVVEEAQR